jgi:hypothetical protein
MDDYDDDTKELLQRIDNNVRVIADILVFAVAFGAVAFGAALLVAELIENYNYRQAHPLGLSAVIGFFVAAALVSYPRLHRRRSRHSECWSARDLYGEESRV